MESTKQGHHVKKEMNTLSGRTKAFILSFYPYSIKECCALIEEIRNVVLVHKFRKNNPQFY